ncbi:hypothetical protein L596_024101 [Steinernema carpocapsae]|uniref:C-type lectin domain-containing protein n=1 Tax=Steinernema carpocapsae TaxID=34508 RepID=A0A4U5MFQ0_STECR|nr:hypothetical protein L596_024101 [Steinernema carpocapsae]
MEILLNVLLLALFAAAVASAFVRPLGDSRRFEDGSESTMEPPCESATPNQETETAAASTSTAAASSSDSPLPVSSDQPCEMTVDLVFVVDQSGSIQQPNFEIIKKDVVSFVETLTIGNGSTDSRVGLVLFDNDAYVEFYLDTFSDINSIVSAIGNLSYRGGGTNISSGMDAAITQVFGGPGNRPGIPDVMLLITDGQDGSNVTYEHQFAVKDGISTFALGVGTRVDYNELALATGSNNNVFNASDWTQMEAAMEKVFSSICHSIAPVTPVVTTGIPFVDNRTCSDNFESLWLNLVFIIDASRGVDRAGFNFEIAMIHGAIANLPISQRIGKFSRVAFVSVASKARRISDLKTFNSTTEAMDSLIRDVHYEGDEAMNIGAGLEEAQRILDKSNDRSNVKNVVVLFSSGAAQCEDQISTQDEYPCRIAAAIKEKGGILMTVTLKFHETHDSPLLTIGTPCYNTRNDLHFRTNFRRLALMANCFCKNSFEQFTDPENCQVFGECLNLAESPSDYVSAEIGCTLDQATLVDVFSPEKEAFLEHLATKHGNYTPLWIGLDNLKDMKQFRWESGLHLSTTVYENFEGGHFPMNQNYCVEENWSKSGAASALKWIPTKCSKTNFYVCQKRACDADNFCP